MSKEYWVTVPVDCHITVYVVADTEEEAFDKALKTDLEVELKGADLDHFELIRGVNTGNICHITHWDIEAEEV